MSLPFYSDIVEMRSFPRVSGDEPTIRNAQALLSAFSPRERG